MTGEFEDFLVSGESEDSLTGHVTGEPSGTPLAMWETEIQDIELEKGESGLGFSILDYQVGEWEELSKFRPSPKNGRSALFIYSFIYFSHIKYKAVTHEFEIVF